MDFVKKHYEKIILSIVLLGLVGALVFLPVIISNDQKEQEKISITIIGHHVEPLSALNLTRESNAMARVESKAGFDFSTTNKLFNPMEWKRAMNGEYIKIENGNEIGAGAAVVTKITPLYLVLTLDSIETNGPAPRYVIGVERQAAANPAMRRKEERYASIGEKKDAFTITQVKGDPANPSQLILKLPDTGETVDISAKKPYRRVEAYEADLKYDPEKKVFLGRRVGSVLFFAGEEYIVVAIDQNEVIISAQSNQKKTVLRYAP
ncbi:MAG: hypothetical protein ACREFE_15370 [Limisphaerales bacterium]